MSASTRRERKEAATRRDEHPDTAALRDEREKSAGLEVELAGAPHGFDCHVACIAPECKKKGTCNCWKADIDPLKVGQAVMAVIREHRLIRHHPLSKDKDDLLGLSCELDNLDALVSAGTEGQ